MGHVKLLELFRCLNHGERLAFEKYLESPYFNREEQLRRLFDYLGELNQTDKWDKKEISRKVLGERTYKDKNLRYLLSALTGHIENFLVLREINGDEPAYLLLLKKSLANRRVEKAYDFIHLKLNQRRMEESASDYLNRFLGSELHYHHAAGLSRTEQRNYEDMAAGLDRFYILRKLQLACELINLKNVLQTDYQLLLTEEICREATANNFFNSPAIEIQYHILLTLRQPEAEAHFEKCRELIGTHKDRFSPATLNDLYQYIKNYCIRMINTGRDEYRGKLFAIYKNILADARLMNHEYLSQWEYKNIVTLGLRLKENAWVKDFIKRYINYLPPLERKNALTYNMAMLAHYEKRYGQAMKILQEVEFTDLYYQLDSRSILLKVYFETDDLETMLYHIAAFKIFLKRNKLISVYQREIYRNFIRHTLKLFRAGTNRKKIESVSKEILKLKNISDRNWLLERAGELLD